MSKRPGRCRKVGMWAAEAGVSVGPVADRTIAVAHAAIQRTSKPPCRRGTSPFEADRRCKPHSRKTTPNWP